MLALFRNNRLTTIFILIAYATAIRALALLGGLEAPPAMGKVGVLYEPLFGWATASSVVSAVMALALVLLQAIQANFRVDEFRITGDRTWLPGLLYIWFTSALPDFLFVSPPLVAATFLLPALRRIFKAYKQPDASVVVFDAGFWITVAGLFYPPAWLLLPAAFIGLGTMRAFKAREKIVLLVGVVVPILLAWLWYFCLDRSGGFWYMQFGGLFGRFHLDQFPSGKGLIKLGLLAALLLTVVFSYNVYFHKKLINVQKYISVLYIFLVITGLSLLLNREPRAEFALLMAPSISIFLSMSFIAFRNRLLAEAAHLMLVGIVLFIQFYPGS